MKMKELRHHVTELSLLTSTFSLAFASYQFMISSVVLIVGSVFNTTIAVIEFQLRRLLIACLISGQLLYLIEQMGSIYKYGMEICQALKDFTRLPMEIKKSWIGWRVPYIAGGEFIYLHRGIALAVMSVLITNTTSFIIEVRVNT